MQTRHEDELKTLLMTELLKAKEQEVNATKAVRVWPLSNCQDLQNTFSLKGEISATKKGPLSKNFRSSGHLLILMCVIKSHVCGHL